MAALNAIAVLKWATAKAKADDLLARGDEAGRRGNRAESKRLLRECRRWRLVQKRYATASETPQE